MCFHDQACAEHPYSTASVESPSSLSRWQRVAPAATLVFLAPVIAEVLFGATRLSYIFVLIPEIMVWGCGALLVREAARRWHGGWASMVLLGVALAVAEECIIQQTSLAPLAGVNPARVYGRIFGVNWIWLLAMLGYETVWVVLIPVQITELIFRGRHDQPWLGKLGLAVVGALFLFGAFIAWYAWVQRVRPMLYHLPAYQPPMSAILTAVGAISVLVLAAIRKPAPWKQSVERRAPRPRDIGVAAFVLSLPWFFLIRLAYGAMPALPIHIPLAIGIAWPSIALVVIVRWSSARNWDDGRRFALVFGAVVASMLAGFGIGKWLPIDLIGKVILNVIAATSMIYLARRLPPSCEA